MTQIPPICENPEQPEDMGEIYKDGTFSEKTFIREPTTLEKIIGWPLFLGSWGASLVGGAFVAEVVDVFVNHPILKTFSEDFYEPRDWYPSFAMTTALGMSAALYGWKKIMAPHFYKFIRPTEYK